MFENKTTEFPTAATTQNAIGAIQGNPVSTSIAQNADSVNTQFSLLPEEKFTGDAIADNENSRPLPPMAESSAPGEGGYVTPVDEAQVLERAVQSTAQGQAEAQATDFDGILNELGEDVVPSM